MVARVSTTFALISILALLAPVKGAPTGLFASRYDDSSSSGGNATSVEKQNALDAQKLNAQYITMKATDACQDGQMACINSSFAQCVAGKWALTPCKDGTVCVALPLVNGSGTSLSCDTQTDAASRFAAVGVQGGMTGNNQTAAAAGNEPKASDDDMECDDGGEDDADDEQCDADDDEDLPDCDDEDATSTQSVPPSTSAAATTSSASAPATVSTTAIQKQVQASESADPPGVVTTTIFLTGPASASSADPQSAVTTTIFLTAAPSSAPTAPTTISLNAASLARRQTGPLFSSVPAGSVPSSVSGSVAASSAPVSVPLASSAPVSVPLSSAPVSVSVSILASPSVTALASAITSPPAQQNPTGIVIGPDGLATATVTVVSISTVTLLTGCAAGPSNPILSSLASSSAVIPIQSSVVTAPASSISVQATGVPSSAPIALSQTAGDRSGAVAPTITLSPAGASSSAAPTAAGIVFSFQSAALAPTQSLAGV